MVETLLLGLGVALALEGFFYAAAPGMMKRLAAQVGLAEPGQLRLAGLVVFAIGVFLVSLAR